MAVVYPLANGNWSTVANWYSAGVAYTQLPQVGDDVYLDNKTLTLDVDVTIANLFFTARSGGVAGGLINCSTTKTVTCTNIQPYGAGSGINFTGTTGTLLTVNANFLAATFNEGGASGCIKLTSSGNVNINGNLVGSTAGNITSAFVSGTGLLTIVGNCSIGGNYGAVQIQGTGRCVITGNVGGGAGAASVIISSTSSTALIVNGNCISGTTNGGVSNTSTGTVTINGNQTAVGTVGVFAIVNSSTGIITINGDCLGALSASPSNAYIVNNNTTGIVNINGNVTARSVGPSASVAIVNNNNVGGTINISGNVSGGSVLNAIGVYNNSTGTVNVGGNITGGSNASNSPAIYSITAGTIDVTGTTTAGLYPALWSTSLTATNILRGNITNALGVPAYFAYKITVSPTAVQTATMQTTTNVDRLFSTSNVSVGAPAVTNVRAGVVYGSTNELTGTMIVPTANNVRSVVPTDATVGTAALTIADFWDIPTSSLTTVGSIGNRLKNASTVQTMGDQIAALTN